MNISGSKAGPKPKPGVVDKGYVEFLSRLPSIADGSFDRVETGFGAVWRTDGHHIHTKGARGGDYWRVPLTRKQHQLCHAKGNSFVESLHGLDFHQEVCKLLALRFGFKPADTGDHFLDATKMVEQAEVLYRSEDG